MTKHTWRPLLSLTVGATIFAVANDLNVMGRVLILEIGVVTLGRPSFEVTVVLAERREEVLEKRGIKSVGNLWGAE